MVFSNKIKHNINLNRIVALSFLVFVIYILTYFIIHNANWLFSDDVVFLQTTAIGKYYSATTWIGWMGRFAPTLHWVFNMLIIIPGGESATAHYSLVAFGFLSLSITSYYLYNNIVYSVSKNLKYNAWLVSLCVIFLLVRIYSVFLELFYAENIITVLIAVFIFLYLKFHKNNKWVYGILALNSVIYMTYCKEPISGSFLVLALANLIFNSRGLTKKQKVFHYLLLINFVVFILLYYFLAYKTNIQFYGDNFPYKGIDSYIRVFRSHKLFLLVFPLSTIRLISLIFKKDKQLLLLDSLLFAGVSYALLMLVLELNYTQYYFPAVVMCLPSLVYWFTKIVNVRNMTLLMSISALYCSLLTMNHIKENQKERINTYPRLESIANLVSQGYSLVFFRPVLSEDNKFDYMMRDYRIGILKDYLKYIMKRPDNIEIRTIETIEYLILDDKTILLYPIENDLNIHAKIDFEKYVKQNNLTFYNNVGLVDFLRYNNK